MTERRQPNRALPVALWSLVVTVVLVGAGLLMKVGAAQEQLEKVKNVPDRLAKVEAQVDDIEDIKRAVTRIENILLEQSNRRR